MSATTASKGLSFNLTETTLPASLMRTARSTSFTTGGLLKLGARSPSLAVAFVNNLATTAKRSDGAHWIVETDPERDFIDQPNFPVSKFLKDVLLSITKSISWG